MHAIAFRGTRPCRVEAAVLKFILVPATGADSDAPVFATALAVARLLGSHLEFLHVRADAQQALMVMASADMGDGVGYGDILRVVGTGRSRTAEEGRIGIP